MGQRLTARDFDRQIADVHIQIAVLNRFTALGTPLTHAATLQIIKAFSTTNQ